MIRSSLTDSDMNPVVITVKELEVLLGISLLDGPQHMTGLSTPSNGAPQLSSDQGGSGITTACGGFMEFVNMDDINAGTEYRSTFMVRRLPRFLSVDQLELLMRSTGMLDDSYDLIYVPIFTGKAHANRGYAFINFKTPQLGALFVSLVRYSAETALSRQLAKCDIVYAHIQGRDDMISNLGRRATDGGTDILHMPRTSDGLVLPPGLKLY